MEKNHLFEREKPSKALAVMALPTIASQIVVLVYNLADTWFIGRTNNPYMVGASSLTLTVYLAVTALSNVFGVGGGSLMVRLIGEKKEADARRVASYSLAADFLNAVIAFIIFRRVDSSIDHSEDTKKEQHGHQRTDNRPGSARTD